MPFRVLTVFGTRPEVIKLAPVIRELEARPLFSTFNVCSSQHTDLLRPFIDRFGLRVDRDLQVMREAQGLSDVASRVLAALDPILVESKPDLVLVQGDTTTALAGALGGFHRKIPVGHVEAGLRSGNALSPFPEEMNRRLITKLAHFHFAATARNRDTLLAEQVPPDRVALTGNPVVDALRDVLAHAQVSPAIRDLLEAHRGRRLIVLTTHRRENFGEVMSGHLRELRGFVERHADLVLVFPVHPNPAVRSVAEALLAGVPRIHLWTPLDHPDFIHLLSRAWLVVSDSGGVQEEVATLGKALLILRENTERPEVVEAGVGRLIGGSAERLREVLEELYADDAWVRGVAGIANPFGAGDSARRIVDALASWL